MRGPHGNPPANNQTNVMGIHDPIFQGGRLLPLVSENPCTTHGGVPYHKEHAREDVVRAPNNYFTDPNTFYATFLVFGSGTRGRPCAANVPVGPLGQVGCPRWRELAVLLALYRLFQWACQLLGQPPVLPGLRGRHPDQVRQCLRLTSCHRSTFSYGSTFCHGSTF
jgi:hypothetical protein